MKRYLINFIAPLIILTSCSQPKSSSSETKAIRSSLQHRFNDEALLCFKTNNTLSYDQLEKMNQLDDQSFVSEFIAFTEANQAICKAHHMNQGYAVAGPITAIKGLIKATYRMLKHRGGIVIEFFYKNGQKVTRQLSDNPWTQKFIRFLVRKGYIAAKVDDAAVYAQNVPDVLKRLDDIDIFDRTEFYKAMTSEEAESVMDFLRKNFDSADPKTVGKAVDLLSSYAGYNKTDEVMDTVPLVWKAVKNTPVTEGATFGYKAVEGIESLWMGGLQALENGDAKLFTAMLDNFDEIYKNADNARVFAHIDAMIPYKSQKLVVELSMKSKELSVVQKEKVFLNSIASLLHEVRSAEVYLSQGGGFHNAERINTALDKLDDVLALLNQLKQRTSLTHNIDANGLRTLLSSFKIDSLARRPIDKLSVDFRSAKVIVEQATGINPSGFVRLDEYYQNIWKNIGEVTSQKSKLWDIFPKTYYSGSYH